MSRLIAVTGATGALGGRVAAGLAAAGVALRLVVRGADRAPALPGAEIAPAADGRTAFVARADTAAVAVVVLTQGERHDGRTYELTGPEALSLGEVAALLADASGRPVRYVAESVEEAYASRAHHGAPDYEVEGWVTSFTAIAAGELARVTGDVQALTGRPPMTLAALLAADPDSYAHLIPNST